MKRVNLMDMYDTPEFYKPPDIELLPSCTEYPNLNSLEYRQRNKSTRSSDIKFFEHLAVNKQGNAVIVANRYKDRSWHSNLWGFDRLTEINGVPPVEESYNNAAVYRLRCESAISAIHYAHDTTLVVADASGTLNVWSTRANASHGQYCLFNIGSRSEHSGRITSMDVFAANWKNSAAGNHFLTADSMACVKSWDMGEGDLFSTQTWRYAHARSISALVVDPCGADLFVTCSPDRIMQLWDRRLIRPIVARFEDLRAVGLTALQWSDRTVYVGDEAGNVHAADARVPGRYRQTWSVFNAAHENGPGRVHRLRIDTTGKRLAVVADNTVVRVINIDGQTKETSSLIGQTEPDADHVRDVLWDTENVNLLYTTGWATAFRKHIISAK